MIVLLALCVVACVLTVARTRHARADREAERRWLAEEAPWWDSMRSKTP